MALLSIILPVYNAAPWLSECLDSILSTLPDMDAAQVILVNDGSTDDSGTICDRYAQQYPLFKVIHKPNGGVASARNAGLQEASGTYIAWIDPDDYISKDWFSEIHAAILSCRPDVIVFDMRRFEGQSKKEEIYGRSPGILDRDLFLGDLYRDLRMLSGLPNKVIRAEFLSGVRFNPELPILEDFDAMPEIMERAQSFYYIPKCLYHYRQHSTSLLHSISSDRAFLSFEIACARAEKVPPRFRKAAETAATMQAYAFCYNHCTLPDFRPKKDHLRRCRNYILQHIPSVCTDPELSAMAKLKIFLTLSGATRIRYKLKRGN